jgi:hypothetical protein
MSTKIYEKYEIAISTLQFYFTFPSNGVLMADLLEFSVGCMSVKYSILELVCFASKTGLYSALAQFNAYTLDFPAQWWIQLGKQYCNSMNLWKLVQNSR